MKKVFLFVSVSVAALSGVSSASNVADFLPTYCTENGTDLGQLVACRLKISELVGADKQRSGAAIEDKTREAVVISTAVKRAADMKIPVSSDSIERFFAGQIEASKFVQRMVMEQPRRDGTPTVAELRDVLDALTTKMLPQLSGVGACRENVLWSVLSTDNQINGTAALMAASVLPPCGAAVYW